MTSSEEARAFKLVDGHSRSRYQCFVSEMFLNDGTTEYTLCFRPISVDKKSPTRYACRYLHLEVAELKAAVEQGTLMASTLEKLDKDLAGGPAFGGV